MSQIQHEISRIIVVMNGKLLYHSLYNRRTCAALFSWRCDKKFPARCGVASSRPVAWRLGGAGVLNELKLGHLSLYA